MTDFAQGLLNAIERTAFLESRSHCPQNDGTVRRDVVASEFEGLLQSADASRCVDLWEKVPADGTVESPTLPITQVIGEFFAGSPDTTL